MLSWGDTMNSRITSCPSGEATWTESVSANAAAAAASHTSARIESGVS